MRSSRGVPSMTAGEVWPVVHAERRTLVHDLEGLSPSQWATASLCPGWDVHDVLAHLVDDAMTTRLGFAGDLVAARFDFDRCNARGLARRRAEDPERTLALLEAASGRTTSAPAPLPTRLVEVFVHGEDIRRPLGLQRRYPAAAVATAVRHQAFTSVKVGGGKERVRGLRLVATDADLDLGAGSQVEGTAVALLLAVSGRPVRPEELIGAGAHLLQR